MTRNDTIAFWGWVLGGWLMIVGSTGYAQSQDSALETARHHMELGQEAFLKNRFADAARHFIDAYGASPFAAFLYNAGMAYEKAGNNEQAIEYYRRYLKAEPKASDYAEVDVKIRALTGGSVTPEAPSGQPDAPAIEISEMEMKSLVSVRTNPPEATVRILDDKGKTVSKSTGPAGLTVVSGVYTVEASHPDFRTVHTSISVVPGQVYIVVVEMSQGSFLGFIKVTTDVPGAAVYIDDKQEGQVGTTPWENVLPVGKHTIWVEKPGYQSLEKEVEIGLGKEHQLELVIERLSFGALLVKSNVPGAKVYLDEKFLGAAPLNETVAPGEYQLRVAADGMKNYETPLTIERGQTTKALVRMNPAPSRTSAWVSASFAAALFIGGGIAGGVALKLDDELDEDRNNGRLASDDPRIMKGFVWGLSADLAFGVGAVVGGMAIYYFLRDPLPPSEGKMHDPVDFKENPAPPAAAEAGEKPSRQVSRVDEKPLVFVAPILGATSAGVGMTIVF